MIMISTYTRQLGHPSHTRRGEYGDIFANLGGTTSVQSRP